MAQELLAPSHLQRAISLHHYLHPLSSGDKVRFQGGLLPAGLSACPQGQCEVCRKDRMIVHACMCEIRPTWWILFLVRVACYFLCVCVIFMCKFSTIMQKQIYARVDSISLQTAIFSKLSKVS